MTGEEKQRGERTTTVAVGSLAKERRRGGGIVGRTKKFEN